MTAAVIELNSLPDAVRSRPQDHDLAPVGWLRLILLFVRRIKVWRVGFKLRAAGVHPLVNRNQAQLFAIGAHFVFGTVRQIGQAPVGHSNLFESPQSDGGYLLQLVSLDAF